MCPMHSLAGAREEGQPAQHMLCALPRFGGAAAGLLNLRRVCCLPQLHGWCEVVSSGVPLQPLA